MFDLGWSEMAIIMLVALIVIGPKDLPKVARTLGQWTGKARALARDFQRSLDDMAREAELDEIKKTIDRAGSTNFKSSCVAWRHAAQLQLVECETPSSRAATRGASVATGEAVREAPARRSLRSASRARADR
jgi:Tat protein translocase TatB subunit